MGSASPNALKPSGPLVSVVLTTRDRPHLLPIAIACFEHQTYPHRELIIVDDGERFPVEEPKSESIRTIHVRPGTPLGIKLNCGIDAGSGDLCMKMDDDDWYAPAYLEASASAWVESRREVCQPSVIFHMGFLFFEIKTWQVHESIPNNAPGATLIFARDDWRRRPFRPLPTDEDAWFFRDQIRAGAVPLAVDSKETFVAVRHSGHSGTLGHTWTHQLDGSTLESYLTSRPLYAKQPEQLFPGWALDVYRRIHAELNQPASEHGAAGDAS